MSVLAKNRLPNFSSFSRTRHDFPKNVQRSTQFSIPSANYTVLMFHATTNTATQRHEFTHVFWWRHDV